MLPLALLFILVPAIELGLLIEIGSAIGALPTIGLIALTGVVGAALAKRQGLQTLRAIQLATSRGEMPVDRLIDGALILLAGALLVTPGVLTDLVGFAALVPGTRQLIRARLKRAVQEQVKTGRIHVVEVREHPGQPRDGAFRDPSDPTRRRPSGPVIDLSPEE